MMPPNASIFPMVLRAGRPTSSSSDQASFPTEAVLSSANLSKTTRTYLGKVGIENPDTDAKTAGLMWMHALAIGYSPAYLKENADGIRQDWPRIPLPDSKKALLASAALGKQIASLLDTEKEAEAVRESALQRIALVSREGGGELREKDEGELKSELAVTAGWGHAGKGGITMPGKGKLIERDYTEPERDAIVKLGEAPGMMAGQTLQTLGSRTCDVYLNELAYWSNIPLLIWEYTIGGYQVIKKWLSYREQKLLGRALSKEEVRYVQETARRIAALLLLEPALDANYQNVKAHNFPWKG
jgi:hypothetical protein